MAELIMTDAEQKMPFLQWDDANLGRAVKGAALVNFEKSDPSHMPGFSHVSLTSCCVPLIAAAAAADSDESTVTILGATDDGNDLGDWEIIVRRI
jgi:hypothetical protein